MYVIALKEGEESRYYPEVNGRFVFHKDKMAKNTVVLYLNKQAAIRAIAQMYNNSRWEILPVSALEDDDESFFA